jgi:hypothetical protein
MAMATAGGTVLACDPLVAVRLRENLTLNGLTEVRVHEVALTAAPGKVMLRVPDDAFRLQAWASLRSGSDYGSLENSWR